MTKPTLEAVDPMVDYAWQDRERLRVETSPPVWHAEPWAQTWRIPDDRREAMRHHYAHTTSAGLIAYTQDFAKGRRDIQTPIKPGRYLAKFFPGLTPRQVKFFADWQSSGRVPSQDDNAPLSFAHTAEEIVAAYMNGPKSCMSGPPRAYDTDGTHPAAVYAAGDLAVAYLSRGDKIASRALCWPANKVFGRVYPSPDYWTTDGYATRIEAQVAQQALRDRLLSDGWKSIDEVPRCFDGARLVRLTNDRGRLIMPYLDNSYHFETDDGELTLARNGDHAGDNTCGLAPDYDNDDEDEDPDWTCEHCDEGQADYQSSYQVFRRATGLGGRSEETWCEYCHGQDTFHCEGFDADFRDSVDNVEIEGGTYTQAWADANAFWCAKTSEWFLYAPVTMADATIWHPVAFADDGFTCAIDGENYDKSEEHPDYPGIHAETPDDELAAYLENRPEHIVDARQLELAA